MPRLVMLDPAQPDRLDRIRPHLPEGWDLSTAASRDPRDQVAALEGAAFAITGDVPGTANISAVTGTSPVMFAVPGFRAVHKWGVGYDNIDLEAARRHGVGVLRTTGSNAVTVAETTLALILAVNRNVVRGHVGIQDGRWRKAELSPTSVKLSGKVVGIIGMGHIGQALAGLLRGFGCTILYAKRTPLPPAEEAALAARHVPLHELLANADVVTLNCELNETTRDMINRETLRLMKPDAILVNAARGGVMVEEDVAEALREGRLRGAGVDVFAQEPITPDNPLIPLDRAVLTPHVGAINAEGFVPSITRMLGNLLAIHEGRPPREGDRLV